MRGAGKLACLGFATASYWRCCSVALHLLSPGSRGLFSRAILQSGTALDPSWGPVSPAAATRHAVTLAAALDCPPTLACLNNRSVTHRLQSVPRNVPILPPILTQNGRGACDCESV